MQIAEVSEAAAKNTTVTFDALVPQTHPPLLMSVSRGDVIEFKLNDGSDFRVDIRKATQGDVAAGKVTQGELLQNPTAPDNPFPQPVPQSSGRGIKWGPPLPNAVGQTYNYTITARSTVIDPHIIIGP